MLRDGPADHRTKLRRAHCSLHMHLIANPGSSDLLEQHHIEELSYTLRKQENHRPSLALRRFGADIPAVFGCELDDNTMENEAALLTLAQRTALMAIRVLMMNAEFVARRRGILVVGPSRSGRSSILDAVGRLEQPEAPAIGQSCTSIKAFVLTAGPSATTSQLVRDILLGLGDKLRRPAFHAVEVQRAGSLLRENGFQILLIDDADDLLDQKEFEPGDGDGEFHMPLADFLSMLAVPFVLVGREDLDDRVKRRDDWFGRMIAAIARLNDPLEATSAAAA